MENLEQLARLDRSVYEVNGHRLSRPIMADELCLDCGKRLVDDPWYHHSGHRNGSRRNASVSLRCHACVLAASATRKAAYKQQLVTRTPLPTAEPLALAIPADAADSASVMQMPQLPALGMQQAAPGFGAVFLAPPLDVALLQATSSLLTLGPYVRIEGACSDGTLYAYMRDMRTAHETRIQEVSNG